jgi:hypothetical protein
MLFVFQILLLHYITLVSSCTVWVDWTSFNSLDLLQAQSSASFLTTQGSWFSNTNINDDKEWRQVLSTIGKRSTISQDNSWNEPSVCNSLPLLSPSGVISASAFISNPPVMLNNTQINQMSSNCIDSLVIGSTSDFTPKSRISVQKTLSNKNLLGIVMETSQTLDFGSLFEDEFVSELLSSNKWPIFRMPFLTPNPKNITSEEQVLSFGNFLNSKIDLSDDRIVLLISNYYSPSLQVLGTSNSVESALFAALQVCSKPTYTNATRLFEMPDTLDIFNSSIARVNPSNGLLDETVLTVWRLGDEPLSPSGWQVSDWTNARINSDQVCMTPSEEGSSAVIYSNGTFGALLNTITNPIQNGSSLGTITIEYNFSPKFQIFPWSKENNLLDMSVLYEPPQAFRTGIAVYSSWSLGILHQKSSVYMWYETAIFDLNRDLQGDQIWHDTISGNVIAHGVLGAPSQFHSLSFDSATASNTTWIGKRLLHFTISSANINAAILKVNLDFNLTLDTNPQNWALVHTNIELEGTSGVRGGHSLSAMRIMLLE